ncbi:MAG TPA: ABC transporter ATP-binding protein, partial [Nevskiales bacterium]|nr:ABC transporter ATP-binding protein [Nevskiales bacterium]
RQSARVRQLLELVGLSDCADRWPHQLSGGQQQRVALARALAYDPPVLLMDEPLSALDKRLREEIQLELRRIHQETGVTILYVTHDQEEALRLSDRIAVFSHGRIEQIGTGEELYENPATHFVAGFVGNSNFLPVRVETTVGATARVVFPDGNALAAARLRAPLRPGDGGMLMVRPERMRIRAARPHEAGNGLGVTVRDMTYLGDSLHFTAVTAWHQELAVRMPMTLKGEHGLCVGAAARIEWDAAQSHVFAQH